MYNNETLIIRNVPFYFKTFEALEKKHFKKKTWFETQILFTFLYIKELVQFGSLKKNMESLINYF